MSGRRRDRNNASSSGKAFNPRLIFSQIVSLQCFHYLILAFMFQVNHVLYGTSITKDRMFTDKYFKIWSWHALPDTMAVLLSSMVGAVLLAIIVEKSKKCLDFSVTLLMLHFFVSIMYGGLPRTWDWYIIHLLGTITMILMGEYLCSKKELDEIPLLAL